MKKYTHPMAAIVELDTADIMNTSPFTAFIGSLTDGDGVKVSFDDWLNG